MAEADSDGEGACRIVEVDEHDDGHQEDFLGDEDKEDEEDEKLTRAKHSERLPTDPEAREEACQRISLGGGYCGPAEFNLEEIRSNNPLRPEDVAPIVEDLRAKAREAGGCCKWLDSTFEGDEALGTDKSSEWAHVEEIADPPVLQSHGYDATDVCQGRLGDCWFLAAIAVVASAEGGRYLDTAFLTKEYNPEGVYCVQFFKDGYFIPVFVDDRIPVRSGRWRGNASGKMVSGSPEPTRGRMKVPRFVSSDSGQELWMLIMEKAYAKVFGSFRAISGGQPHQALMDITGGSSRRYHFHFEEDRGAEMTDGTMVKRLQRFLEEGYMLAAASGSGSDAHKNAEGIVLGHAYSILDVTDLDEGAFIRLRNPWGRSEWKGKYSDLDKESWTPALQEALAYDPEATDSNDGAFWMSWQDFGNTDNFTSIYVCRNFPLKREGGTWTRFLYHGEFDDSCDGGCENYRSVKKSPQFGIVFKATGSGPVVTVIQLQQSDVRGTSRKKVAIGMSLWDNGGKRIHKHSRAETILEMDRYSTQREVTMESRIPEEMLGKTLTLVCSTFRPKEHTNYTLTVYVRGGTLEREDDTGKFLPPLPLDD